MTGGIFIKFWSLIPSISSSSSALGRKPTVRPVSAPFLLKISVGMLLTPNWAASPGSSSTFTLQNLMAGSSAASSSMTGESIRQGPHHGAQKSMHTGRSAFTTSCSKFSACSSVIFIAISFFILSHRVFRLLILYHSSIVIARLPSKNLHVAGISMRNFHISSLSTVFFIKKPAKMNL